MPGQPNTPNFARNGVQAGSKLDVALQASVGKRVLVVEGPSDKRFFESVLKIRRWDWAVTHSIVEAGGRSRAMEWTKVGGHFPTAICYVDRDVWTDTEVETNQRVHGRLVVTEGWCVENLLVAQAALGRFGTDIQDKMRGDRDTWVRAGTFWWVWKRWQDELDTLVDRKGFGMPLPVDLSSGTALRSSLNAILPHLHLGPVEVLVGRWESRLDEVLRFAEDHQWSVGVHGKRYSKDRLIPMLRSARPSGEDLDHWCLAQLGPHLNDSITRVLTLLEFV